MRDDDSTPGSAESGEAPEEIREALLADTTTLARRILPGFTGARDAPAGAEACVTEFVRKAVLFGRLEKLFQGDILFDLPYHKAVLENGFGDDPEKEGELLAHEEVQLLGDDALDLAEALDSRGIKVITVDAPFYAAGLLFRDESGPAILTTRNPRAPRGRWAVAHAYGHLVSEVSPYTNRLCLLGDDLRPSPEEVRAESFAETLLAANAQLEDGSATSEAPFSTRFLNLALAAHARGFVDDEGLARLLDAPANRVTDFLDWARPRDGETD